MPGDQTGSNEVMRFLEVLIPKWSAFEGYLLFTFDRETLTDVNFMRFIDSRGVRKK
jgi:hypothetical protein